MDQFDELQSLWRDLTAETPLEGTNIQNQLAANWLVDFGWDFLRDNLPTVFDNWLRKCKREHREPHYNLNYLRNYLYRGLKNEREVSLVWEEPNA